MKTVSAEPVSGPSAIASLLCTASAALEIDPNTARACIARAAALLRVGIARLDGDPNVSLPPRGGLAPWQARRVMLHVTGHLTERLQARELAAVAELSTSHFFRAFRESFGDAPMLYVTKQRMQRAQELMLHSREPLAQIALACGLCDQAHFTRTFRRIVGMSPRAWRRQFAGPRDPQSVTSEPEPARPLQMPESRAA
jgi:AraC family transcriptional regulator